MRIAMLHPSLTWRGGAERQILILATELQQKGHGIEIFTCAQNDKCFPELAKKLKINVVKAPFIQAFPSSTQKRTFSTRLAGRFRGYTAEFPSMVYLAQKIPKGFDLINNHNAPTEWAAYFAKRKLNAPIVWNCNEPPFYYTDPKQHRGLGKINLPLYELFDRTAVDYIDTIVSNSQADSARIQKAYGRSSKIVRPGITLDLFHKASGKAARAKYGLENEFVLLQVANIARDKKQNDAITALHYLSKKFDNVKLILIGQGPKEELIDLSKRLGVKDKVMFLQGCSDEELADLYAACDVFVFPAEITWGLVVIEAMANSKPVVVSKRAGVSEIIRHGENGFVFDEPNPINMAGLIEKLIVNPDLGRRVGISAYGYVKDNFTWRVYAEKMEAIFEKTVARYR
ncbi:MAG: glycosyltransferase family 4 protein [Candidatus Bathyarchaeia archaeon]